MSKFTFEIMLCVLMLIMFAASAKLQRISTTTRMMSPLAASQRRGRQLAKEVLSPLLAASDACICLEDSVSPTQDLKKLYAWFIDLICMYI